ncbi:tautomerase family protein [Ramlibacter sp. 2FC]|uniref:tautomerase family protein n=1 Tax=Ramlibacter sp. 2FC TaxID=2502188 RepID=UPI0010F65C93|nr:tautomerase family protein [Ramlibacter sp. 2FC]
MPHVIIKLWMGRTEKQKNRLAQEVCQAVMNALGSDESSISVAVVDVEPSQWQEKVYKPDILGNPDKIYKRPGYEP